MRIISKENRLLFYSLMLLALMVRSIVPAGFMPAQAHDGKVAILICTGSGPATMLIDSGKVPATAHDRPAGHTQGSDKDGDSASRHSCPYAPVLAQGMPGAALENLAAVLYESPQPFVLAASMSPGIVWKPWFSQGPPLS